MRTMLPVALALALMGAGCDNSGSNTTPTTPVTLTTETFTGTVDPGGTASSKFTVAQTGEVDVTLTAAGPPPTISMGLAIGTPSDTTCVLNIQGANVPAVASTTPQLVGTASPGAYCVAVYDIGNQASTVSYTVVVSHP